MQDNKGTYRVAINKYFYFTHYNFHIYLTAKGKKVRGGCGGLVDFFIKLIFFKRYTTVLRNPVNIFLKLTFCEDERFLNSPFSYILKNIEMNKKNKMLRQLFISVALPTLVNVRGDKYTL